MATKRGNTGTYRYQNFIEGFSDETLKKYIPKYNSNNISSAELTVRMQKVVNEIYSDYSKVTETQFDAPTI
jgi:hypothetical protein